MGQALLWVLSIYQLIYPLQVSIIAGTLQMRKLREKCLGAHLWPAESSLGQLISSVRERQVQATVASALGAGGLPLTQEHKAPEDAASVVTASKHAVMKLSKMYCQPLYHQPSPLTVSTSSLQ